MGESAMVAQFIKFCVVGGSGVVIDFSLTYLLKEILRVNKYIANSVGFILAASSNYLLNRIWTFQSHDPAIAQQYMLFIGISSVGLCINNLIIYILSDRFHINFYISKLIAICVVTIWNFIMNYIFTFK